MRTAFFSPSYLPFWLNSFLQIKSSIILPFSSYLSFAVFWRLSFSLLWCLPLFLSSVLSSSLSLFCDVFLCFSLLWCLPLFVSCVLSSSLSLFCAEFLFFCFPCCDVRLITAAHHHPLGAKCVTLSWLIKMLFRSPSSHWHCPLSSFLWSSLYSQSILDIKRKKR